MKCQNDTAKRQEKAMYHPDITAQIARQRTDEWVAEAKLSRQARLTRRAAREERRASGPRRSWVLRVVGAD